MGTKREIGSALKDHLKSLNAMPSDKVWKDLEVNLEKRNRRSFIKFWYWIAGVGLLFLGFVLGGIFFNSFSENYSNEEFNKVSIIDQETDNANNKLSFENQSESTNKSVESSLPVIVSDGIIHEENINLKNKNIVTTSSDVKEKKNINRTSNEDKNLAFLVPANSNNRVGRQIEKNNSLSQEYVNSTGNYSVKENIVFVDSTSNALVDILEKNIDINKKKNNNLLSDTQEDIDSLNSIEKSPWSVSVSGIINLYDIIKSKSLIDKRLDGNKVDRNIQLNYGMALHHNLYNKWTLRIGANLVKYDQFTRNINPNTINFEALEYVTYNVDEQLITSFNTSNRDIEIRQNFTYLEIPIQARYSFIGDKIDLAGIVGFQNRLLLDDRIFLTSRSSELQIGRSKDIYDYGVSAHLSLASRVQLYKKIYFNLEPAFYYHLRPFETDVVSLPAEFRLTTSLEYKF